MGFLWACKAAEISPTSDSGLRTLPQVSHLNKTNSSSRPSVGGFPKSRVAPKIKLVPPTGSHCTTFHARYQGSLVQGSRGCCDGRDRYPKWADWNLQPPQERPVGGSARSRIQIKSNSLWEDQQMDRIPRPGSRVRGACHLNCADVQILVQRCREHFTVL